MIEDVCGLWKVGVVVAIKCRKLLIENFNERAMPALKPLLHSGVLLFGRSMRPCLGEGERGWRWCRGLRNPETGGSRKRAVWSWK